MPLPAVIAGVPIWLWKLAAAMYGGHLALKGAGALGQYGLGKRQIEAAMQTQLAQSAIGKREEKRTGELITQLLAHTAKGKAESREFEMLKMLMSGAQQQSMMVTTMMQAAGQRPVKTGYAPPPSSLVSLLR